MEPPNTTRTVNSWTNQRIHPSKVLINTLLVCVALHNNKPNNNNYLLKKRNSLLKVWWRLTLIKALRKENWNKTESKLISLSQRIQQPEGNHLSIQGQRIKHSRKLFQKRTNTFKVVHQKTHNIPSNQKHKFSRNPLTKPNLSNQKFLLARANNKPKLRRAPSCLHAKLEIKDSRQPNVLKVHRLKNSN